MNFNDEMSPDSAPFTSVKTAEDIAILAGPCDGDLMMGVGRQLGTGWLALAMTGAEGQTCIYDVQPEDNVVVTTFRWKGEAVAREGWVWDLIEHMTALGLFPFKHRRVGQLADGRYVHVRTEGAGHDCPEDSAVEAGRAPAD